MDLSNMAAEVEIEIAAPPEVVWDLVTDLTQTPHRNLETVETSWVPPHDRAEVGAVFAGTNVMDEMRWTVECHVTVADRGQAFEWTVLDPAEPSSSWWYRLEPTGDGGTLVRHGFQHGPGPSHVRAFVEGDPGAEGAVVEGRTRMLERHMRHTLACIRAEAEGTEPPPR
ncbi:MAG TPA: SRPBCC family protein [Aquihabitans sp.]|nr:SRPBCC family protein [Aquihabitans sp.]